MKAIGGQPREDINLGVDWTAVARVLDIEYRCKQVVYRFDQPTFAKVELVGQRHQGILHFASNFCDDVQSLLIKVSEELSQVASISEALTFQSI